MMIKFALKTMITELLILLFNKHIYSMIQVQRNKKNICFWYKSTYNHYPLLYINTAWKYIYQNWDQNQIFLFVFNLISYQSLNFLLNNS